MERLDKVTFVIKTTGNRGFLDGNVFRGQHLAGTFNAVVIEIIDRCALCHAAEITTEIFGIHSCDLSQTVKTDVIIIILRDIGKNIFDGV